MEHLLALLLASANAFAAQPNLKLYVYDFSSEKSSDWVQLTTNNAGTTNPDLAMVKNKTSPDESLVMFRKSDAGDHVCEQEKSQAKPSGFKKLPDVKGWSCVFSSTTPAGDQLTAVRSMIVKGKHLRTSFAIVLSAQKMKNEKFVSLLKSAKEIR